MNKIKKIITSLWVTFILCVITISMVWANANGVSVNKKDGDYTIEVSMEGGTGKASVTSPAEMIVKDGKAYAHIEWSSSNYDYMIVKGEKYVPINKKGNSVFEIPILAFDEPVKVIADTTAMSVPHEISYTFTFDSKTISGVGNSSKEIYPYLIGILFVIIIGTFIFFIKKKHKR
ncbi:MAG: hypothetical protein Q4D45_03725 [Lachnospiraceae bacterium]|nr:hypothetical protein [Lachnospiraceae bacterium]